MIIMFFSSALLDAADDDEQQELHRKVGCAIHDKAHPKEIEALVKNITEIDNNKNDSKMTLCHYAAMKDAGSVIEMLVKNGANPNAQDWYKNTPLHVACTYNSLSATTALLKCDANTQITNEDGDTPLNIAQDRKNFAIVKMLVKHRNFPKTTEPEEESVTVHINSAGKHKEPNAELLFEDGQEKTTLIREDQDVIEYDFLSFLTMD
jgi:ankyrin repeat protein